MGELTVQWAALYLNSVDHTEEELVEIVGGRRNVARSGSRGERGYFGRETSTSSATVESTIIGGTADQCVAEVLERVLPCADRIRAYQESTRPSHPAPVAIFELVLSRSAGDLRLDLAAENVRGIARLGVPFRVTLYPGSDGDVPEPEAP